MSRKQMFSLVVLGLVLFGAVGVAAAAAPSYATPQTCGIESVAQIIGADGTSLGRVVIRNTAGELYTQFFPASGWRITSVDYMPARYYRDFPKNTDGSLNYEQFPNHRTFANGTSSITFRTTLNWQMGDDLHLAGHLVMVPAGSTADSTDALVAWGEGKRSYNGQQYFKHIVQPCLND
jgi:hypothetical protein